jgi:hypothetical protein
MNISGKTASTKQLSPVSPHISDYDYLRQYFLPYKMQKEQNTASASRVREAAVRFSHL